MMDSTDPPPCYLPRRYVNAFIMWLGVAVGVILQYIIVSFFLRVVMSVAAVPVKELKGWSDGEEGLVLSSFYWGLIFTQVPSGWLAKRVGFRIVFFLGMFGSAIFTGLMPFAVDYFYLFVALRVLSGFVQGVVLPCVFDMIALWYPKSEKSVIVAFISSGSSWGNVLSMGVSSSIVSAFGWEYLFYGASGLGLVWCLIFLAFVRSRPEDRSNIFLLCNANQHETEFIGKNKLEGAESLLSPQTAKPIPWLRIISNPAVIAYGFQSFTAAWGWFIFLSWLPTYLRKALNFEMQKAGIVAFLPYVLRPIIHVSTGAIADALANRKLLPLGVIRKVSQGLGAFIPASILILISFVDFSPNVISGLLVLTLVSGGLEGGVPGNIIDWSREYSGILMGLLGTLATVPGIVGVYSTGIILDATGGKWGIVFVSTAVLYLVSILVYSIFGRAEPIDFDSHSSKPIAVLEEAQNLIEVESTF